MKKCDWYAESKWAKINIENTLPLKAVSKRKLGNVMLRVVRI